MGEGRRGRGVVGVGSGVCVWARGEGEGEWLGLVVVFWVFVCGVRGAIPELHHHTAPPYPTIPEHHPTAPQYHTHSTTPIAPQYKSTAAPQYSTTIPHHHTPPQHHHPPPSAYLLLPVLPLSRYQCRSPLCEGAEGGSLGDFQALDCQVGAKEALGHLDNGALLLGVF